MLNYVHIPFCNKRCGYCRFVLTTKFDQVKIKRYLGYLEKEIREFFASSKDTNIKTIYFWGGTPSILDTKAIGAIVNTFKESGYLTKDYEITFEANPENINNTYLKRLHRIGINRLSIGIQSINENTLKEVGRIWV